VTRETCERFYKQERAHQSHRVGEPSWGCVWSSFSLFLWLRDLVGTRMCSTTMVSYKYWRLLSCLPSAKAPGQSLSYKSSLSPPRPRSLTARALLSYLHSYSWSYSYTHTHPYNLPREGMHTHNVHNLTTLWHCESSALPCLSL